MMIPTELTSWLDMATRRLSDESSRRVRHEIAEHYRDAVESRCRDGVPEDTAREQALEDLGSAEAAGRAFQRVYLTSFQEKLIHGHTGRPETWRMVIFVCLLLLGTGAAVAWSSTAFERAIGAVLITGMLMAMGMAGLAAPWLHRRGRTRVGVMASVVADWLFYFSLLVGTAVLKHDRPWQLALFACTFVLLLVLYLPLIRKLANRPAGPVSTISKH